MFVLFSGMHNSSDIENLQVTIGPEFFAKIPNDYSDADWALIRELAQNAIDCGSTYFNICCGEEPNTLTATNNGPAMDRETLVSKFFTLGATSKGTDETGGFGLAKLLICFCQQDYMMTTGHLTVKGSGASYTIGKADYPLQGTTTTLSLSKRFSVACLRYAAIKFAQLTNWKGQFCCGGDTIDTSLSGTKKATLEWGTVYTTNKVKNTLVVRVNGCPMFTRHIAYKNGVILEITGDTKAILNSNRDSLKSKYQAELEEFVSKLNTNSAVLSSCTYEVQEGNKISVQKVEKDVVRDIHLDLGGGESRSVTGTWSGGEWVNIETTPEVNMKREAATVQGTVARICADQSSFILRNETGLKVDRSFRPGSLSSFSQRLLKLWTTALVEVHHVLGMSSEFTIGFIISETALAMHEYSGKFGTVYYISPVSVDRVGTFRTMRRRKIDKGDILASAIHEVVHGAGYNAHDESFASAITEAFAKVINAKIKL
jgi:hypothetical protein